MNKKLLMGISSIGVAAGFWACGGGAVEPLDQDTDGFVQAMLETGSIDFAVQVKPSKQQCSLDPVCSNEAARQQGAVLAAESSEALTVPSSSSVAGGDPLQSSSSNLFTFSSAGPFGQASSSSQSTPVFGSSSSEITALPAGTFGTCAPASATTELNVPVKWEFSWNTETSGVATAEIMKAEYTWTFTGDGASMATASGKSASVSYSASGGKGASISIQTSQHGLQTIQCKALNVNGAPISGCKCSTAAVSVDFTATPDVVWTVSGCTSTVMPLVYEWDGVVGTDSYTKTFTAAQTGYVPKLRVSHADNTIIEVTTCPAVKTTNGPEYSITKQDTKVQLPAGESNVVIDLPDGWHGAGNTGNCTLRCDDAGQPVTITVGTSKSTADYSATLSLPVSKTVNKSSLVIGLSAAAKCQIAY